MRDLKIYIANCYLFDNKKTSLDISPYIGNSEIKIVEENINIEVSETFTNFGTLQGLRGASAYEVYLETTTDNPKKTIEEWQKATRATLSLFKI